ncbi:MAG: hypothetical protein KGJ80_03555 [Chloroflexota bacterium]|nr:hypothetical protein [Chloroflexota bacterium]
MSTSGKQIIRASEIGEYVFCHRAWWLHRVKGIASANREQMQAGAARHVAHGRAVQRADSLQRAALAFLILALVFATAFALAVWFSPR